MAHSCQMSLAKIHLTSYHFFMKTIKILLMGITGDLAKKKIIPAIAQFVEKNQTSFDTELIGFSRSEANSSEIEALLNDKSKANHHSLTNISYIQGQYDDTNLLDDIFSSLKPQERLLIYLAIPPTVFIPFLEKACPLHPANIDIIIEKPFGQNLEEAQDIIAKSQTCTLTNRIHFFDHYAFKASSKINNESLAALNPYTQGNVTQVEIKALENLDVKGREGYYEQAGALKDMFQHLVTIYLLGHKYFHLPPLHDSTITINELILGQYDDYQKDVHNPNSTTDTYFKVHIRGASGLGIIAESGKSLSTKSTSITLTYTDQTKIIWNLDPEKHISVVKNSKEIMSFNLIDNNLLDHTRLFDAVVHDDFDRFVGYEEIIDAWKLYGVVTEFAKSHDNTPITYKSGIYPIQRV
jgi:glucose-6-phosphate 1-dehydrogenase